MNKSLHYGLVGLSEQTRWLHSLPRDKKGICATFNVQLTARGLLTARNLLKTKWLRGTNLLSCAEIVTVASQKHVTVRQVQTRSQG